MKELTREEADAAFSKMGEGMWETLERCKSAGIEEMTIATPTDRIFIELKEDEDEDEEDEG